MNVKEQMQIEYWELYMLLHWGKNQMFSHWEYG